MKGYFDIRKLIDVTHCITECRKRTTIVSFDAEKAFDKIQHPFMIKKSQKLGKEGNSKEAIYEKSIMKIIRNGENISFIMKNKARMPSFATSILAKRNKRHTNWKG